MGEGNTPSPEHINLKPFSFTLTHEDQVCQMYLERKVNWTITKTYYAVDRKKAKELADKDQVAGVCGHIYSRRHRGKK